MKTTKYLFIALIAASMAACGGKSNNSGEAIDSTEVAEVIDSVAEITSVDQIQAPEQVKSQILAAIESGDQTKAESLVAIVKQKVEELKAAGNETALKEYASALENIYKEKAEQIKSLGTLGNTISTAVSATGVEEAVTALKNLGVDVASTGDAAAQAAADGVKSQAGAVVNDAKSKVNDAANDVKAKANDAVNNTTKKANDAINNAKSKANDAVNNAAKKALGM